MNIFYPLFIYKKKGAHFMAKKPIMCVGDANADLIIQLGHAETIQAKNLEILSEGSVAAAPDQIVMQSAGAIVVLRRLPFQMQTDGLHLLVGFLFLQQRLLVSITHLSLLGFLITCFLLFIRGGERIPMLFSLIRFYRG